MSSGRACRFRQSERTILWPAFAKLDCSAPRGIHDRRDALELMAAEFIDLKQPMIRRYRSSTGTNSSDRHGERASSCRPPCRPTSAEANQVSTNTASARSTASTSAGHAGLWSHSSSHADNTTDVIKLSRVSVDVRTANG